MNDWEFKEFRKVMQQLPMDDQLYCIDFILTQYRRWFMIGAVLGSSLTAATFIFLYLFFP